MTVTTGGMGWKESKLNILLVLFDADDVATDTDDDDDDNDNDDKNDRGTQHR